MPELKEVEHKTNISGSPADEEVVEIKSNLMCGDKNGEDMAF